VRDTLPDLSSRQLRAVVAVAEHRSFIAAAAALRISQPALTRTIQQTEAALGVELFSRTTRQVTATAAGKECVALAERLLNDLRIGIGNMRRRGGVERGQLIVSSVLPFAGAPLPDLLAQYGSRHPGIELHLREGMHGTVLDDVRGGVADFGVGYVDDLPDAFAVERLGVELCYAVMPADHPLARRKVIDIRALTGASFVSYPPESRTRRAFERAAAIAGFTPRYAMTANRLRTLFGLVRARIGIAIVPASERATHDDEGLACRAVSGGKLACRVGLIRLRKREIGPAATELLAVMKRWIPGAVGAGRLR
jgi:DNA-binding transcriptional LysR family regulator